MVFFCVSRVCTDFVMAPAQTYTTQIPPSFGSAAQQYSQAQQMMHIHNIQQNFPVVRPGFTALLNGYHHAVEQGKLLTFRQLNKVECVCLCGKPANLLSLTTIECTGSTINCIRGGKSQLPCHASKFHLMAWELSTCF